MTNFQTPHLFDCIVLGLIISIVLIVILYKIRNYIKELETTIINRFLQNEEKKYGLELEKLRALTIIAEELARANRKGITRA